MKIFSIPDTRKFLELVERSRGDVTLRLPDGEQINLKQSHIAQQLLRIMRPSPYGLQISLSDSNDAPAFLQYMMEAGVNP